MEIDHPVNWEYTIRQEGMMNMINMLKNWHNSTIGERAVKALRQHGFEALYCETCQEAVDYILQQIPEGARIGVGGSSTLREIGLIDLLYQKGFTLYDHGQPGLSAEEIKECRYKQLNSDVFLTSSNAITLKGELVNRDGAGNRVASMIFGPQKTIVVAGINKVVKDLEEAEQRIRNIAAPLNNKRLERPNPCVKTGQCADCQLPTRICNVTTIIHRCPSLSKIHVVIIGENHGF